MTDLDPPPHHIVADVIDRALREDLGRAGDLTSFATIPADHQSTGEIIAREAGIVAGLPAALEAFGTVGSVVVEQLVADGTPVEAGTTLARVRGHTRALLSAERTALNLLGHLSGIATTTRRVADAISHTRARVVDTRKTTPGLRALEKYAVRAGGGVNHRFGLDDAVLIKDNHLAAAGSVRAAVEAAREKVGHMVKIELEVDSIDQLETALELGVDAVLLDNMTPELLVAAVELSAGRCVLEASGGITPDSIVEVAETGVDLISMGWITHSAPRLDVAFDL